jgi:ATP-dependent DNA helicase UvrD/PcrA
MEYLKELNPAQRDAVTTLSGPLLVLAGAGTGKTRVITYRMVELIRSGIAPDRILSVTFTNKAAREMLERTRNLLGKRVKKKPLISTFHSLCVRILRQDISALGYPLKFGIYDRGDQESAARTALRNIRVDDSTLRPGDLLSIISGWKSLGITPDFAADHVDNDKEFLAAVAYRKYQGILRSSGAVDFDDLLLLTGKLFDDYPEILEKHQNRFDHVQIDEYQDTNGIQFKLISALVEKHQCICVVGDDDQSIYGWRGAEVEHILNFDRYFPGSKTVRLQDNYRCTENILHLANKLVRHNKGRHEKTLIAHKENNDTVIFREYPDELGEAESTVREIKYYSEELDIPLGNFAILFRTNEQPRIFETELRRQQIPYTLVGGQSFFDRKEIRDILSYLKALEFPQDELSLLRIINTPARGIGNSTVEKILKRAVRDGTSFWNIIPVLENEGELPKKAIFSLNQFHSLMKKYRTLLENNPQQMPAIATKLLEEINYESEIKKQYKDQQQQMARQGMIEQFIETIKEYVEQSSNPSIQDFLEEATLMDRDTESDKDDKTSGNSVKLMTLHSAKGLEFPNVYLVGLEEGILPHKRSIDGTDAEIDEERRLAYVGITRAMDRLSISRAATRKKWGKPRQTMPSRFLFEMQSDESEEEVSNETEENQNPVSSAPGSDES